MLVKKLQQMWWKIHIASPYKAPVLKTYVIKTSRGKGGGE